MNRRPKHHLKELVEYFKGLGVLGKIGWTVLLGYIVGRIIYWVSSLGT